jgi:hypothetical protein
MAPSSCRGKRVMLFFTENGPLGHSAFRRMNRGVCADRVNCFRSAPDFGRLLIMDVQRQSVADEIGVGSGTGHRGCTAG